MGHEDHVPRADERRLRQLRSLTEVSRALTYATSVDDVVALTVRCAAELLGADKVVLMLTNADGLLSVRGSHAIDVDHTERFREPLGENLIDRLRAMLEVDTSRFLGVPLVVNAQVMGMLAVRSPEHADGTEQEWLLGALADQAAVSLEKTRLDEAATFRERVLGIVSHDLRNPIAAIHIAAGVLLRNQALDERSLRLATVIRDGAERADRMVRDLLDYTQAHLGDGIPVHRRDCELLEVVQLAVEEQRAIEPDRIVECSSAGSARGQWDPDRLAQVVGNLLSNAFTHGCKDGVVRVSVHAEPRSAVVAVNNLGAPIAPERMQALFEPMARVSLDNANASRSVGLGLYIVKRIVEAHGGTVGAASNEVDGTTFTVVLPR